MANLPDFSVKLVASFIVGVLLMVIVIILSEAAADGSNRWAGSGYGFLGLIGGTLIMYNFLGLGCDKKLL